MVGKTMLLGALALLATEAAAATVTVTEVERLDSGPVRIGVRYTAADTPSFRLVPVCPTPSPDDWVLPATVRTAPARGRATLETHDDLTALVERRVPCRATGLAVEMLRGDVVVARADVPNALPPPREFVPLPPPPAVDREPSRLGLAGQKYKAPQTRMSQAGVTWSLTNRVSLLLSYERTAYGPTMARDHDDGIVTGVKLGF
jgi:hypothetical protein